MKVVLQRGARVSVIRPARYLADGRPMSAHLTGHVLETLYCRKSPCRKISMRQQTSGVAFTQVKPTHSKGTG